MSIQQTHNRKESIFSRLKGVEINIERLVILWVVIVIILRIGDSVVDLDDAAAFGMAVAIYDISCSIYHLAFRKKVRKEQRLKITIDQAIKGLLDADLRLDCKMDEYYVFSTKNLLRSNHQILVKEQNTLVSFYSNDSCLERVIKDLETKMLKAQPTKDKTI